MELSTEHEAYLTNKHQGGLNNQKGNTFEVIYATKEIIRLYALVEDLEKTVVSSQLKNAFVDDFQILYPDGLAVYHQCKDVTSLSWGKEEKGDLLYDFKWQKTYSTGYGEFFRLKIVYSHPDCDIHIKPIPEIIEDVTEREHFPAYLTLNALLIASKDLRDNIMAVLAPKENGYTFDDLSAFAEIIRSNWLESANKKISLLEIKNQTIAKYSKTINFKDFPNAELPNELKTIFDRFSEFSYRISGNTVFWTYRRLTGRFNPSDELISSIIKCNPTEILNLIILLQ